MNNGINENKGDYYYVLLVFPYSRKFLNRLC